MDIQDTFPQLVWQTVASIPENFVTTYGDVAQLTSGGASDWRSFKTSAGRQRPTMAASG